MTQLTDDEIMQAAIDCGQYSPGAFCLDAGNGDMEMAVFEPRGFVTFARKVIADHEAKQAQGEGAEGTDVSVGQILDSLHSSFVSFYDSNGIEADSRHLFDLAMYSSVGVADILAKSARPQQGEDARDALRYRFTKSVNNSASAVGIGFLRDATDWPDGFDWIYGDDADAEIDAAIAAQKGGA